MTTFNDLSQSDGLNNIISKTWDFGDGTILTSNTNAIQHTYITAGTYTTRLMVSDAFGCVDSVTRFNLIHATNPIADFTVDTLTCPGGLVNFKNTTTDTMVTNFWSFGNGDTSNVKSPVYSYIDTGLYGATLKIKDQYGCIDSIKKSITVDKPIASFTVSDSASFCSPFEVQFTNTSHYIRSQVWDLGNGRSTRQNPVKYYVTPGTYQIQLAVTSPGGCRDTAYKSITLYDTVGSRITYTPLNGCKPLSVDLATFSKGPVTYTWDFGDGVLLNNTVDTLNHIYDFFGDFVPKIILTDPTGCIIPVSGLDTIRIIGADAKFGLDNKFFCDSGLVTFTDSTTFNDPLTSYSWNYGDGTTSNLPDPGTHYYASPGFYTVSLHVQTQNNCVDTFTLNNIIKVVESPLISAAGDSIICVNDPMQHIGIFERPDTSVIQWLWQLPNGNTSTLQNPVLQQYGTAGNFVVTATATNSSGCNDIATKNILVNPLPVVSMPPTLIKQAGFPITIPATFTSNVVSYNWTPPATLSCADCPQPESSTKFNTTYSVAFVDSNGCRNSGQIQVIVVCPNANVFVPNTFSPNGDGSNDVFYVRGRGLERVKTLRIFNRWGEVVFEQNNFPVNDPLYGWNGTHKGNKPHPDVYVYQVEVFCENSDIIRFEGNVALIQ
jgi:gliding motility-associated-like protein